MYTREITITIHQPSDSHSRRYRKTSVIPQMMTAAACLLLAMAICVLAFTNRQSADKPEDQVQEFVGPAVPVKSLDIEMMSCQTSEDIPVGIPYDVPACDTSFKSFMDWRTITSPTSKQYEIQCNENTWTDNFGFRRYGDYYLVALGTYYSDTCGDVFEITLDTGETFLAMTGDIKCDSHTDAKHQLRIDGTTKNLVEFIVDSDRIPAVCQRTGDMSYADNGQLSGSILSVTKMETKTFEN